MVPGGGVGQNNARSAQWPDISLGENKGGFTSYCMTQSTDSATIKSCSATQCAHFRGSDQGELLAGCGWYVNWLDIAKTPTFNYKRVTCPAAFKAKSGM